MDQNQFKYILVDEESDFNEEFLRSLDKKTSENWYPLVITTSTFGTRAMDYRSPQIGITLVVAEQFRNH